ncbi:MAG: hypothetical protein FIB01_04885 [Gemmatimonadetes bacterium]|nr:hypothetical protein [Gemmatimonadota bacterium]
MKPFQDETGRSWVATAYEEQTPRHHGRWYLVMHPAAGPEPLLPMPEVRWQSRRSAERTLATMSEFELRRRLFTLLEREGITAGATPEGGAAPGTPRSGAGNRAP